MGRQGRKIDLAIAILSGKWLVFGWTNFIQRLYPSVVNNLNDY
jgi:hypothetical protein